MELKNDMALQTADEINQLADDLGKKLADKNKGIKTNQVRNFFASINVIRTEFQTSRKYTEKIERKLIMLKPQLAYAKGRESKVQNLQEFIFQAIDSTVKSTDKDYALDNFFALVEAVVAYHKFYGGRDN